MMNHFFVFSVITQYFIDNFLEHACYAIFWNPVFEIIYGKKTQQSMRSLFLHMIDRRKQAGR